MHTKFLSVQKKKETITWNIKRKEKRSDRIQFLIFCTCGRRSFSSSPFLFCHFGFVERKGGKRKVGVSSLAALHYAVKRPCAVCSTFRKSILYYFVSVTPFLVASYFSLASHFTTRVSGEETKAE